MPEYSTKQFESGEQETNDLSKYPNRYGPVCQHLGDTTLSKNAPITKKLSERGKDKEREKFFLRY